MQSEHAQLCRGNRGGGSVHGTELAVVGMACADQSRDGVPAWRRHCSRLLAGVRHLRPLFCSLASISSSCRLHSRYASNNQYLVTGLVLFVVGTIVISTLASRARAATRAALLAQEEQLRNSLLASLSHDLRTPLAVMAGSASSLRDERAPEPTGARSVAADDLRDGTHHERGSQRRARHDALRRARASSSIASGIRLKS